MPELPEVQTVVNTISPRIIGRRIERILHLRGDIVSPAGFDLAMHLTGRTVANVHRRAKRIVMTLDDGNCFYVHLGMTGRLTVENSNADVLAHTHLTLELPGGQELRFRDPRRFGGVFWLGRCADDEQVGPEPLQISVDELLRRLKRTTRHIKTALLDQKLIAGIGNIYADEALFSAGIKPTIRANRLTREQVTRLNRAIKQVLKRAINHRGSTLRDYVDGDGREGEFQKLHKVYDRTGRPCWNCKTPIKRIVLGGRSTHFCPNCQKR